MRGVEEAFNLVIDGALPEARACAVFRQVLSGVREMHRLGMTHADIKLENIMIMADGSAALIDFGLSRIAAPQPPPHPVFAFSEHTPRGSKSYVAPEFVRRRGMTRAACIQAGPLDVCAVDVWALGVTLFTLLTGFFPFDRAWSADWRYRLAIDAQASALSTVRALFHAYRRRCHLPTAVVGLLDGMLTIEPTKRYTIERIAASPWVAEYFHVIAAHDRVPPLHPALWRVRARVRWGKACRVLPDQWADFLQRAAPPHDDELERDLFEEVVRPSAAVRCMGALLRLYSEVTLRPHNQGAQALVAHFYGVAATHDAAGHNDGPPVYVDLSGDVDHPDDRVYRSLSDVRPQSLEKLVGCCIAEAQVTGLVMHPPPLERQCAALSAAEMSTPEAMAPGEPMELS